MALCGAGLIAALLHALWGPIGLADNGPLPPFNAASFPAIPPTPAAARNGVPEQISCSSAGTCSAALRSYTFDPAPRALLASEINGRWGPAEEISLPAGAAVDGEFGFSQITSVSCPSSLACVAVGQYTDSHGSDQVMSVARGHGVWQRAIELELPANANSTIGDEAADLMSVSCWSIRNCVAVGHYGANSTPSLAMVATDRGGRWGRAVQVKLPPGADTAIGHEIASLWSVACTGTGDCVATGQYNNRDSEPRPMLVTETNGKWARAVTVRAPAGEGAAFVGLGPVACAHRGNCVAIGTDENGDWLLTALQAQGRWTAAPAPPAARGTRWALQSVSCHAAGCVAVGRTGYRDGRVPDRRRRAARLLDTAASPVAATQRRARRPERLPPVSLVPHSQHVRGGRLLLRAVWAT